MRAFITGITGFLGSQLARQLSALDWEIVGYHRETSPRDLIAHLKYTPVIGSLYDSHKLTQAMKGCDVIFHVAAKISFLRRERASQYETNVLGTRSVVEAALSAQVPKLVYTSSIAAIGTSSKPKILTEAHPLNQQAAQISYCLTKYLAEKIALDATRQGLWVVAVNPGTILGPGDIHFRGGRLIRDVALQRIPLLPPGGGSFVGIDDVVAGHLLAVEKGKSGERYILGGEMLSYTEIVQKISHVIGIKAPQWQAPSWLITPLGYLGEYCLATIGIKSPLTIDLARLGCSFMYCSSEKAQKELGWDYSPIESVIEKTYQWYKESGYLR